MDCDEANLSMAILFCMFSIGIQHVSNILTITHSTILDLEKDLSDVDSFHVQVLKGGWSFVMLRVVVNHFLPVLLAFVVVLRVRPRGVSLALSCSYWVLSAALIAASAVLLIRAWQFLVAEYESISNPTNLE